MASGESKPGTGRVPKVQEVAMSKPQYLPEFKRRGSLTHFLFSMQSEGSLGSLESPDTRVDGVLKTNEREMVQIRNTDVTLSANGIEGGQSVRASSVWVRSWKSFRNKGGAKGLWSRTLQGAQFDSNASEDGFREYHWRRIHAFYCASVWAGGMWGALRLGMVFLHQKIGQERYSKCCQSIWYFDVENIERHKGGLWYEAVVPLVSAILVSGITPDKVVGIYISRAIPASMIPSRWKQNGGGFTVAGFAEIAWFCAAVCTSGVAIASMWSSTGEFLVSSARVVQPVWVMSTFPLMLHLHNRHVVILYMLTLIGAICFLIHASAGSAEERDLHILVNFTFVSAIVVVPWAWILLRNEKRLRASFVVARIESDIKQKANEVLVQMLPQKIIDRLTHAAEQGKVIQAEADLFPEVAILFIRLNVEDSCLGGSELVKSLNHLFVVIDGISSRHRHIYKVETVGSEYICAAGVPEHCVSPACAICTFALEVMMTLKNETWSNGKALGIQMGAHSGQVAAGIAGQSAPQFRLFGDTVNTTSRMKSQAKAGEIVASSQFVEKVRQCCGTLGRDGEGLFATMGNVELKSLGVRDVKGKGSMEVWSVISCQDKDKCEPKSCEHARRFQRWSRFDDAITQGRDMNPRIGPKLLFPAEQKESRILLALNSESSAGFFEWQKWYTNQQSSRDRRSSANGEILTQTAVASVLDRLMEMDKEMDAFPRNAPIKMMWYPPFSFTDPAVEASFRKATFMSTVWTSKNWVRFILLLTLVLCAFVIHALIVAPYGFLQNSSESSLLQVRLVVWISFGIVMVALTSITYICHKYDPSLMANNLTMRFVMNILTLIYCVAMIVFCMGPAWLSQSQSPVMQMKNGGTKDVAFSEKFRSSSIWGWWHHNLMFDMLPYLFVVFCHYLIPESDPVPISIIVIISTLSRQMVSIAIPELLYSALVIFMTSSVTWLHRQAYMRNIASNRIRIFVEGLLQSLLPTHVIQLMAQKKTDLFSDDLTCGHLFADIKGFTAYCNNKSADELFGAVADLFGEFDSLCKKWGVTKIDTIGDAYWCAIGLEGNVTAMHMSNLLGMALEMQAVMSRFNARNHADLGIRVGVHYGKCVGCVLGVKMPRYHLFGSPIDIVQYLETGGTTDGVVVSHAAAKMMGINATCESMGEIGSANVQELRSTPCNRLWDKMVEIISVSRYHLDDKLVAAIEVAQSVDVHNSDGLEAVLPVVLVTVHTTDDDHGEAWTLDPFTNGDVVFSQLASAESFLGGRELGVRQKKAVNGNSDKRQDQRHSTTLISSAATAALVGISNEESNDAIFPRLEGYSTLRHSRR